MNVLQLLTFNVKVLFLVFYLDVGARDAAAGAHRPADVALLEVFRADLVRRT